MIYIFSGLIIFIFCTVIHIWLHRLLQKNKIKTLKTCFIFVLGGLINIGFMFSITGNQNALSNETLNWWTLPLPLTSVFIYFLLSISYVLTFIYPNSKQISPTYKIILLLQKKKSLSEKEILSCFSDKELIFGRLRFLVSHGFVKELEQNFVALPKGKKFDRIINFYRRLMSWDKGG